MEDTSEENNERVFATLLVEGTPYIEIAGPMAALYDLARWVASEEENGLSDDIPKARVAAMALALGQQLYGAGLDAMTMLPDLTEFMDVEKVEQYYAQVAEIQDK